MNENYEKLTVTLDEAAGLLEITRPTLYKYLDVDGGIQSFRMGRRRLIPYEQLRTWINNHWIINSPSEEKTFDEGGVIWTD